MFSRMRLNKLCFITSQLHIRKFIFIVQPNMHGFEFFAFAVYFYNQLVKCIFRSKRHRIPPFFIEVTARVATLAKAMTWKYQIF